MSLQILDGFDNRSDNPLDANLIVPNEASLQQIRFKHKGMIRWVESSGVLAVLQNDLTIWKAVQTGDPIKRWAAGNYKFDALVIHQGALFQSLQDENSSVPGADAKWLKILGQKGDQGLPGTNGKSAYQLWLENGNTGDIQSFFNSLKGKDGETFPLWSETVATESGYDNGVLVRWNKSFWESLTDHNASEPGTDDTLWDKYGGGDAVFAEGFVVNFPENNTGTPNGYVVSAGDRIEDFIKLQSRKATPPSYNLPSSSIGSNPGAGGYEFGTLINSLSLGVGFNQADAGLAAKVEIFKNGTLLIEDDEAIENIQITEAPIKYQAVVTYSQGPVKNDSLGNPSPAGQIPAGTVASNELTFSGYRNLFYGFSGNGSRSLPGVISNPGNGTQFQIEIPAGSVKVRIVYPDTIRDIFEVKYVEDSNANITGNLTRKADIVVPGANSYNPVTYKVFEFVPVEPFPVTVHYNVTL